MCAFWRTTHVHSAWSLWVVSLVFLYSRRLGVFIYSYCLTITVLPILLQCFTITQQNCQNTYLWRSPCMRTSHRLPHYGIVVHLMRPSGRWYLAGGTCARQSLQPPLPLRMHPNAKVKFLFMAKSSIHLTGFNHKYHPPVRLLVRLFVLFGI